MIQNYQTLSYYVDTFCKNHNATFQCQKVWSTPHYLVLRLRLVGENCFIYLGRGRGFEGFFPKMEPPTPEMRISDTFQLFFKKYLEGQYLSFEVDKLDRIIAIKTRHATVAIFYKARELYFILHDPSKGIYLSWLKKWIAGPMLENVFDYFNDVGRDNIQKNGDVAELSSVFILEKKFVTNIVESDNTKKTSFNLNKKKNINKDIELLKKTIELKNEFIQIESVNGLDTLTRITKFKLRVKFTSDDTVFKKREKVLNKLKNIEVALNTQMKRLAEMDYTNKSKTTKKIIDTTFYNPMKERLVNDSDTRKEQDQSQDFKIHAFDHYTIAVGSTAKGNDQLRSHWGNGEDIWVHLDTKTSAHMVIKLKEPSFLVDALNDCAKLYHKNSQNMESEIALVYCLLKNVKGMKGAAGLVSFKKEKRVKIYV